MRDAFDHAFQNPAVAIAALGIVQRAEPDGVQHGDGPRAHGEDVAQDAADAGGRALERFDEAGMVVRFDLERDRVPLPDIDNPGVLSGADQDAIAARGQLLQVQARAFIGAVLAPHHREDAGFGLIRLAAENLADFL